MKLNIAHIAKLANLPLTDEEISKFEKQLSETLQYIEELNEIDTENVDPTNQVTGLINIFRDDTPSESLSQKDALLNSKHHQNGYFKVKGILENQ